MMIQAFKKLNLNHLYLCIILMMCNLSIINVFRHGSIALIIIYTLLLLGLNCHQKNLKQFSIQYDAPILICIGLFISWVGISAFWSYNHLVSIKTAGSAALILCLLMLFYATLQNQKIFKLETIINFIVATALLTAVLLTIQHYYMQNGYSGIYMAIHGKWRSIKPNSELICILMIPLLAFFIKRQQFPKAFVTLVFMIFFAWYLDIKASYYGFVLAAIAGLLSLLRTRWVARIMQVCTTIYLIALPFVLTFFDKLNLLKYLTLDSSFSSLIHRFYIWRNIHNLIIQKPLLGWGGGISAIYARQINEYIKYDLSLFPSHPHNIFMQTWFELGLVGIVLTICFLWRWIDLIWKNDNRLLRGIFTFYFIHTLIILSISHSLWHSWWISWIGFGWILTYYVTNQTTDKGFSLKT